MHTTRKNTGANSHKTCPHVLHDLFLSAGPVAIAVNTSAAFPTPKGIPRVPRLATPTTVPALYAGVHGPGNAGCSRGVCLINWVLYTATNFTNPAAAPTPAAAAPTPAAAAPAALSSLFSFRGAILTPGLVAPIPVCAAACGASAAHAQAPQTMLTRALLTPWPRALRVEK